MPDSPLFLGLVLGLRHALDADHVATIASLVVGRSNLLGALRTALFRGVGHSFTFLGTGLAIVLFDVHVPAEFEITVEVSIAVTLLALGAVQLIRAIRAPDNDDGSAAQTASRPLALGSLHGLAGSAGIALLALATIRSKFNALLYLTLFAGGSIAGMLLITGLLTWSFQLSSRLRSLRRGVIAVAGLASCLCGVLILVELSRDEGRGDASTPASGIETGSSRV